MTKPKHVQLAERFTLEELQQLYKLQETGKVPEGSRLTVENLQELAHHSNTIKKAIEYKEVNP